MITLVGDIIKLSKLDEGSVELEKENVDLYQMTREIVSRLALQAEKRRIQVEVVGEHVECFGIRQILDEMIYNICENAIKYNKENGKVNIWVGNTLNGKKSLSRIPESESQKSIRIVFLSVFTGWIRAIPERPVEQVWVFQL